MDGGAPSDDQDAGELSRERIVSAAIELVLEHHGATPNLRQVFSYLTPGAVAERAGLSRGLIYHHWSGAGSGDAFSAFLSDVTAELWRRAAAPERLVRELSDEIDNLSATVLITSLVEFDHERGPNRPLLRAATELALAGAVGPEDRDDAVDRLSAAYRVLGERLGYEPVPPLSHDDLATAITCVFMGFVLTDEVLPERVARRYPWAPLQPGPGDDAGWTLLAIVLESVIDGMVQPVEGEPVW